MLLRHSHYVLLSVVLCIVYIIYTADDTTPNQKVTERLPKDQGKPSSSTDEGSNILARPPVVKKRKQVGI